MANFKFWTPAETNKVIAAINKYKSASKAATIIAPQLKRSYETTYQKGVHLIKKGLVNVPEKPKKEKKPTKTGMLIPKGFSFDFVPTRAEMFKDHVKLYF